MGAFFLHLVWDTFVSERVLIHAEIQFRSIYVSVHPHIRLKVA